MARVEDARILNMDMTGDVLTTIEAGSAEFMRFKLCGSRFGNRRKAAEFLKDETLRYQTLPVADEAGPELKFAKTEKS